MDEQEKLNKDVSNVPAPIEDGSLSEELMIVSDGVLPIDAQSRTPEPTANVPVYDATRGDDSMHGGYASVNGSRVKNDNKFVWIVIIVMTVMCLAVGICSSVITAKLMQKGDAPPVISVDGDIQQNISAVVAVRKSSIAEVKCGSLSSSGIVMKRDGKKVVVLTNAHAIAQYVNSTTANLHVRFFGDDEYYSDVSVLGYDGHYDVAVLSVAVNDSLAVYDIDGSAVLSPNVQVSEGDYVVSIGNAMSLGVACYDGIISRKSELLECDELFGASGKKTVPVFRTTAVINAGMSGGGVFDMKGRLIGLGTYRMSNTNGVNNDGSSSTDVEDTGFATPMSVVYPIYRRILDSDGGAVGLFTVNTKKSSTSAIGFVDLPLIGFNCEYKSGELTVKTVSAQNSKVKSGDVITKIGDYEVTSDICGVTGEFLRYHRRGSGKALALTVRRGNADITVTFDEYRYAI